MCGIFAYSGNKRNAVDAVLEGLSLLDYRGYDSWGISTLKKSNIQTQKFVGSVNGKLLSFKGDTSISIGHTRWATCGGVTKENAHPHSSSNNSFVLAHNGIVENFEILKKELISNGYKFKSETDTEVIVYLIEKELKSSRDFLGAVQKAFLKCEGRNTIIILKNDGDIIGVRNGSPLVVGVSTNNEVYFSSDTLSFAGHVDKTITLDNHQMVTCKNSKLNYCNILTGKKVIIKENVGRAKKVDNSLGKFKHFMLKEIHEQPEVIDSLLEQDKNKLKALSREIKKAHQVYCIGSGTAGAAAAQMAYYLRTIAGINAISLIGAEAKDYFNLFKNNDLVIALSQSGETADVLEVLEYAKTRKLKIASFVNMHGSLMTKISDFVYMAEAGPEICVMSTKVFFSQICWGYLVAKEVQGKMSEGVKNLSSLRSSLTKLLNSKKTDKEIANVAKVLVNSESVYLLGKGQNLQIIKEGMVKIIEGSYIHAHAIPAGDLKHYAITLMQKGVNVIALMSEDENMVDTLNAIHEIKARGASVIGISPTNISFFDRHIHIDKLEEVSAILAIVPLQLLAYKLAVLKGNNVDKPRNIAKSVTVK